MQSNDRQKALCTAEYVAVTLFVAAMVCLFAKRLLGYSYWFSCDWASYTVSDWLINYKGGFVRRGLIGQILYEIFLIHPFDVRLAILLAAVVFSAALLILLLCMFRRRGWSPVVLFTTCCLANTLFIPEIRRDFLVLLLSCTAYWLYARWLRTPSWHKLLIPSAISVVLVLSYEPVVFFVFPLLFIIIFQQVGWRQALLCILPIAVTTVAVFVARGTTEIGRTIWASWAECMQQYPDDSTSPQMGYAIEALGWELLPTFAFHLSTAYLGCEASVCSIPLVVVMFIGFYYLVVFADVPRLPLLHHGSYDRKAFSTVLLFQMIVMLPMFTVLSCDWARNITLCTVSTIMLIWFFPNASKALPRLSRISASWVDTLSRRRWLTSQLTYVAVALFIPAPYYEAPILRSGIIWRLLSLVGKILNID